MNSTKPPKNIRRKIKELSLKAYEIELRKHLGELYNNFKDWDNNKLKSAELSDLIHEFHHGASREMFNFYNSVDPGMAVGRAIVLNIISKEEISEEMYPYISNSIKYFESQYSDK
jgi:hypothetical protein